MTTPVKHGYLVDANIPHWPKGKLNSYQISDKLPQDRQETVKPKQYSGLFGHLTCENDHFVCKGPCGSCTIYIRVYTIGS